MIFDWQNYDLNVMAKNNLAYKKYALNDYNSF